MSRRNLLGAGLCALLFVAAFAIGEGAHHFLNAVGLAIVLSGTAGAALLGHPIGALQSALRVAWNTYREPPASPDAVVRALMDIVLRSRRDGLLSLERMERQVDLSFLKSALEMLVDGYDEHSMRDVLETEMRFFRRRHLEHERVFRNLAQLAPAFGVAGSVVGLIGMLGGLGDTATIASHIPLALTSTLYGVILANFVFHPVAESIQSRAERELLVKQLVVEGVAAVHAEHDPRRLERKLLSFLTPSARPSSQASLQEIRRRYRSLRVAGEPVELATAASRSTEAAAVAAESSELALESKAKADEGPIRRWRRRALASPPPP